MLAECAVADGAAGMPHAPPRQQPPVTLCCPAAVLFELRCRHRYRRRPRKQGHFHNEGASRRYTV
eukprot:10448080-Alexandrium_andersonii.AAC.1